MRVAAHLIISLSSGCLGGSPPEPPEVGADVALADVLGDPMAETVATDHYARGYALLKEDDPNGAVCAFRDCLLREPTRTQCHWEAGWAYWKLEDWTMVVESWKTVALQDPAHETIGRWLPKAERELASAKSTWPKRGVPKGGRVVQDSILDVSGRRVGCADGGTACEKHPVPGACP